SLDANTASSLYSVELLAPPGLIQHKYWNTRPSKVVSHTGFMSAMVTANAHKPVHHGANLLKFARSLQSAAEGRAEHHWKTLRVLIFTRNPRSQWITKLVHKHREKHGLMSAGLKSHGFGTSHKFHHTIDGFR
ncbi:hypothetical protein A6R68_01713, partial [Neotoma lepida]